jgi:tetratricopeptide (TPR) repeat protein
MKKKNSFSRISYGLILLCVLTFSLFSCKKTDQGLLERMRQMEEGGEEVRDIDNDEWNIKMKKDIDHFSKILDEKIEAGEKLGTYYKLIGLKYMDYSMFHLALEAFEEALAIYPENPNVLYNAGLASARLSKTSGTASDRNVFLEKAERYYLASLAVNNRFSSPMYGLAILYVYELNEPELAIPLLEQYNSIQKSSMKGRFLLASAYFASGNEGKAVEEYTYIIDHSEDDIQVESARSNRNSILRGDNNEL